ncbi:MAG: Gfo/Idh/MocA family protein [Asgard group archaeon]
MRKIKISTIGAGAHATNILYPSLTYLNLGNVKKIAVCDLKKELAKKVSAEYGFQTFYVDYRKMLEKEKPDGVIVCINARQHPQVVVDCIQHGAHVLVEKPPAETLKDAKRMLNESRKTGKFIMIDHQKRYATAYRKAMEITKQNEFGEIAMIESKMHGYPYESLFTCLMEWQIHIIDLIRAFCGEIKEIKALQKKISENRAAIALLLKFENDAIGTLNLGTEGWRGCYCERLEVVGDKGEGVIVENARKLVHYRGNVSGISKEARIWEPDWTPIKSNQSIVIDGYVGLIKKFLESVQKHEEPLPNIYDGVKNLEAIYEIADQLEIPKVWGRVRGEKW